MTARSLLLWLLAALYAVMWAGGTVTYLFRGGPAEHERWTAPAFLALAALLVLLTSAARDARWLVVVLLLGFGSEYAAVRCDCIFGPYSYTDALAPRLLEVPIVMSAAWTILIAYVIAMLARTRLRGWTYVVVASAWMTAIDLVIDPLAAGPLGYWVWERTGAYYGIPAWNFAGWFAVSALMFVVLRPALERWTYNPWAARIGLSVVVFFTVIAVSYRFVLPAAAGAALVLVHAALAFRPVDELIA